MGVSCYPGRMPKLQDAMSLDEKSVQKLAEGVDVDLPRKPRKRKEHHDGPVQIKRKSVKAADKLFADIDDEVYEKAMELAEQNWRRLEIVDSHTLIVKNNEVH
jgi:hypothetical protein